MECLVLRCNSYTEHMETVTVGTNELVAEDPEKLQNAMEKYPMVNGKRQGFLNRWDGKIGRTHRSDSCRIILRRKVIIIIFKCP